MKKTTQLDRGLSLIELLITVVIIGLISVSFYRVLSGALQFWHKGSSKLSGSKEIRMAIPQLYEQMSTAKRLLKVSLLSNPNGYIQYLDDRNRTVSLYRNTLSNQLQFHSNSFPFDSLVLTQSEGPGEVNVSILVQKVNSFQLSTYKEDPDYFRVASPNNLIDPVSLDAISSIKYVLLKTGETEPIVQIVHLFGQV